MTQDLNYAKYITTENIITRTNKIKEKIEYNTLTITNMTEVSAIDEIITKGKLLTKKLNMFIEVNIHGPQP